MKAYTDYPIKELGDEPGKPACIRQCTIISYDGNKYATVQIADTIVEIKAGYLYTHPGRNQEVPNVDMQQFLLMQKCKKEVPNTDLQTRRSRQMSPIQRWPAGKIRRCLPSSGKIK